MSAIPRSEAGSSTVGSVMVVGGGIAGIEAALKLAQAGKRVYLVERNPSIGGHMAMFDKTFPTLDCSACILTPKMSAAGKDPNITLLAYSEVVAVGDGKVLESGEKLKMAIKKGDRVLFGKYSGTEVKLDDEEYLIMREDEVLGILQKK